MHRDNSRNVQINLVRLPGSQACDIPVPPELLPQPNVQVMHCCTCFFTGQARKLHPVLEDGNCLFRALSHQLTGEQSHVTLRKIIVDFEALNPQVFARLVVAINEREVSEHLESMNGFLCGGLVLKFK